MADLALAFKRLLSIEGGWANVVGDAGGVTKYGITIPELSAFLDRPATAGDIEGLTEDMAQSFYKEIFWDRIHLDLVQDQPSAYAIFDQAVNRGPVPAVRDAQQVLQRLGAPVVADGVLGPTTAHAINALPTNLFVYNFMKQAVVSYCTVVLHNPDDLKFLAGWISRACQLMTGLMVPG